jgi:1-acyl-sn-glycerol-3-phosphate acyltransferase
VARRRSSDRTYRVVNRVGALVLRLWGVRLRARGLEHLPADGPAVVAANHTSYLDFVLVEWAARRRGRLVRFMSKASVFDAPVVGRLMRAMGHVRVERWTGASAYRAGRRLVEAGEVVGVFPEATISRSFRVKALKPGAAGLALHGTRVTGRPVPLVPVVAWGGHRLLTVDGRRTLRRGVAVELLVGEPLLPLEGETPAALTARLRSRLESLLDEAVEAYPQRPRSDADRWWVHADRGGTAPDVVTGAALDRAALERVGAPSD